MISYGYHIFIMSENLKSIPIAEWQEAPKDALSEVIKKLEISPETEKAIRWLKWEKLDRCMLSLEDIFTEVEEQKLWKTDKERKIQDTLENEYGITISSKNKVESKDVDETAWALKELQKNLESVKKLDPTIVSEELSIAKSANPLPNEVKLTIAKSSNSTPEQVDEAIKSGSNPQINNLIDTYYLTNPNVQSAIEKRLPETKLGDANIAFQELRATVRDNFPGILSPFNPKDLPDRITDQSNATQWKIIETVNSLTKWAPDTMITRTGDKLSFQDPKDDRYTYDIDMDKKPLVLTKKLWWLSISRELGEARDPNREKNDKTRSEVTTLVRGLNEKKKEVLSSTMKDGSQVVSEWFSWVVSNTLSQLTLRDPAGADFSRKMLESGANVINMEKGRLEKLVTEKKAKDPLDSDIGAIQWAIREIDALIESMQRVRDKCIIQAEDPKNNHALWEKNTNDTLRTLVWLGFDELGQENLDALMRWISTRDNQHWIWQTGQLDMTDSFTMDKQLLDMRDIVTTLRKNSWKNERETMQDIWNSITKNEWFRNMWNNRSALSKWIQDQGNATTTKFAQNTVAWANSENR